jgi:hypothetical protein
MPPTDAAVTGRSHWTSRYHRDRDRVLGRRFMLSQDPDVAAEQLAEAVGGLERAGRWAAALLAALDRRRAA